MILNATDDIRPIMAPSGSPSDSPSSTISIPESTLPTPDQIYSSRRSSFASSPDLLDEQDTVKQLEDVFTSTTQISFTPSRLSSPPALHASASNGNVPNGTPDTPSRRRATLPPSRFTRAPPPPPILLRRPTDLGSATIKVPIPSGSPTSARGGLNISGLSELNEDGDSLGELIPTPRRTNLSVGNAVPVSPAWQSITPPKPSPNRSRPSPSPQPRRQASLDTGPPMSPLGPERFEPTTTHGLHSRNLSLFFPQPGAPGDPATSLYRSPEEVQEAVMPEGKKVFGGAGDWKFGSSRFDDGTSTVETPEGAKRSKRRGHHHKHSLSHNFFSFLDPTQKNPALAPSPISSPGPSDRPQPVPMPLSVPSLSPLPPSRSDPRDYLRLSLGILEFLIGAGLWVEGQMSGWRCLAGVGYLVVFDAIGVGVSYMTGSDGDAKSLRRPYGTPRFVSLLYFAQSLFLVFAAVYIAKESIEQVILGSGAHEHALGGSHGHGEAVIDGDERPFPHFLLLCAAVTSLFSGGVLGNHSKLVEAVGPLFLPTRYIALPFVQTFSTLLANPFSLTVAGSSLGILLGSMTVPPSSLHSFDSALSLLLTLLTATLSHPPTLAFAHVLLQTAPSSSSPQMRALRRTLKDITLDSRILGLGTMRCWCITPSLVQPDLHPPSSANHTPAGSVNSSPRSPYFGSSPNTSPNQIDFSPVHQSTYPSPYGSEKGGETPLVVTLMVHIHPDTSDREVLEVTKMVWGKVSGAVKCSAGGGEVSVGIKRGWEGLEG